jgi:alkylhydroperoxidase family enzyme
MAWIKEIPDGEATGLLKEQYEAALKRAGRVFNIVRVMSLNAPLMRDSMAFYITLMKGPSPLRRAQREMIATVVSAEVGCHY